MAKKFYAQKDALGFPIPGTLMSASKVPATSLEIPAENTVAGVGETVVSHPGNLRYFVRKDVKGNIIPNSLFTSLKTPSGLFYEFKLIQG